MKVGQITLEIGEDRQILVKFEGKIEPQVINMSFVAIKQQYYLQYLREQRALEDANARKLKDQITAKATQETAERNAKKILAQEETKKVEVVEPIVVPTAKEILKTVTSAKSVETPNKVQDNAKR